MKKILLSLSISLFITCLQSCKGKNEQQANDEADLVDKNSAFAAEQYGAMMAVLKDSGEIRTPRTYVNQELKLISPRDWTSGFIPGSLWYLYELTGEETWKVSGIKYTEALDSIKYFTGHHDIGFMIGCSYGNALRLTGNQDYKDVIMQAARSLSTRYNPTVGLIQSWNPNPKKDRQYTVIIDNMMNLELLFDATELSGDSLFYHIAVSHADNTMKNHYRPDYSTWHVVDYSPKDGSIRHRGTQQGYSDASSWARRQAWGVYGYAMCYRKTKDPKYLEQAEKASGFIFNHPNYPEDGIPYWDFDDPNIPHIYRDASAGAILASALYELSTYSSKQDYKAWADRIMKSLSDPEYRSASGENGNFILTASVGSLPENSEVNVPLNYADYYFLEALKRKRDLENGELKK